LTKSKRTPQQDEAFSKLTEAATPNVYSGDSPLNPGLIEVLQQDVNKGPEVIGKITNAKLNHIQYRRRFVPIPVLLQMTLRSCPNQETIGGSI